MAFVFRSKVELHSPNPLPGPGTPLSPSLLFPLPTSSLPQPASSPLQPKCTQTPLEQEPKPRPRDLPLPLAATKHPTHALISRFKELHIQSTLPNIQLQVRVPTLQGQPKHQSRTWQLVLSPTFSDSPLATKPAQPKRPPTQHTSLQKYLRGIHQVSPKCEEDLLAIVNDSRL